MTAGHYDHQIFRLLAVADGCRVLEAVISCDVSPAASRHKSRSLMKPILNLLQLAVLYACTVAIFLAASCMLSLYRCELGGGEFKFVEWLMPGVAVFSALVLSGTATAYLIGHITSIRQGLLGQLAIQLMLGSLLGLLPLAILHLMTKSFSFNYRPSFQEVPFLMGGLAVVLRLKLKQVFQGKRTSFSSRRAQ